MENLDRLYTYIAVLSSNEFSDKIRETIRAEHNVYGIGIEAERASDVLELLKAGSTQESILDAVQNQQEHLSVALIKIIFGGTY